MILVREALQFFFNIEKLTPKSSEFSETLKS